MVHNQTLSERVSDSLRELAERRGFRKALAERMGFRPSGVTPYVKGERHVTLPMLEAISELSGVPVANLVVPPDSSIKQLNADEAALYRALHRWPLSVTRALCAFVAFFADEEPAAGLTRNLHELWRGLQAPDREWLYGIAVMLREGILPPDLRQGLVDSLKAELQRRAATRRDGRRHG